MRSCRRKHQRVFKTVINNTRVSETSETTYFTRKEAATYFTKKEEKRKKQSSSEQCAPGQGLRIRFSIAFEDMGSGSSSEGTLSQGTYHEHIIGGIIRLAVRFI
jgi:hypothetical protein